MARSKHRRPPGSSVAAARASAPVVADAGATALLADLRRELAVTQVELARTLGGSQRAVSHVEHEPNPRVATVATYVHALGGRLQLRAIFADRVVELELPQASAARAVDGQDGQDGQRPDGVEGAD